jgi:hypothetical protein
MDFHGVDQSFKDMNYTQEQKIVSGCGLLNPSY